MSEKIAALRQRYTDLMHAMQTGVAYKMERDPKETTPKHLRVGVNSAMVDTGAMAKLLIEKGVITEEEYLTSLVEVAEQEVERYQEWLRKAYGGANITLG